MRLSLVPLLALLPLAAACGSSDDAGSSPPPRCPAAPISDVPVAWSLDTLGTSPVVAATPDGAFLVAGTAGPDAALAGTKVSGLFVAKIAATGDSVLWSQSFATTDLSSIDALAVDDAGDVYVGGETQSKTFTIGSTTMTRPPTSVADPFPFLGFVAKLAGATGAPVWVQGSVGGTTRVHALDVRGGAVAVSGLFNMSTSFGGKSVSAARYAGYVAGFDAKDGTVRWVNGFDANGSHGADATAVGLDGAGHVFAAVFYDGALTGTPPPPAAPEPEWPDVATLLLVGSAADGTWTADRALVSGPSYSKIAVLGADEILFVGSDAQTFGADLSPKSQHTVGSDGPASFASGAVVPAGGYALVGQASAGSLAWSAPTIDDVSLRTKFRTHEVTTALVAARFGPDGALAAGWDVPTTGRVQPGNPGSYTGKSVAVAPNGTMLFAGELDGIVNLDRCGIASTDESPSIVVFAVAP